MRFPMMLILVLPLLAAAPAPETPAQLGRFGDFTFDASMYAVDGNNGLFTVRKHRGGDDDDVVMLVTIKDGPVSACSVAKLDEATNKEGRDRKFRTLVRDGFEIHMVSWYQGCRNARPPSVMACTVFRGRVYRFGAGSIGCRGGPGFGSRADGFLGSLAPAP
ncbi:MAG: hypothetical protein SGI91_12220 [Alphaproteobacteria bacterium]|nr:hypothetical protein [Alphaproteobacteria bacterium]